MDWSRLFHKTRALVSELRFINDHLRVEEEGFDVNGVFILPPSLINIFHKGVNKTKA